MDIRERIRRALLEAQQRGKQRGLSQRITAPQTRNPLAPQVQKVRNYFDPTKSTNERPGFWSQNNAIAQFAAKPQNYRIPIANTFKATPRGGIGSFLSANAQNFAFGAADEIANIPQRFLEGGNRFASIKRDDAWKDTPRVVGAAASVISPFVDTVTLGGGTVVKEFGKQAVKNVAKQGFKYAVKKGAAQGALYGMGYGGLYGAQEGDRADAGRITQSAVIGAGLGGLLGGVTGGVSSIPGLLKKTPTVEKQLRDNMGRWTAGQTPVRPKGMTTPQWEFQLKFNKKYNRNPYTPVWYDDIQKAASYEVEKKGGGLSIRDVSKDANPLGTNVAKPLLSDIELYHGGRPLSATRKDGVTWFSSSEDVAGANSMEAWKWQKYKNARDSYKAGGLEESFVKDFGESGIEKAKVALKKPFVVDAKENFYLEVPTPKEMQGYTNLKTVDTDMIVDWAKKNGHDGVIVKNVLEGKGSDTIADTYAVFDNKAFSPFLPQSGKVRIKAKPEPLPWETKPNKVPTAQQIDQQINGGVSLKPKSNAVVSPADTTSQTFAESMTLSGNSGKGGFKGLDKEVQDAYQGWVNSIKATPVEGFLKKKDFTDLDSKGVNGIFEFQAGNKTGRYKDVKRFFDDKYKSLKDEGIDFNYKKDYLPQLWDNTQEEVAQVFGRNLSLRPSFSIDSIFKDYQEGIAKGLKPRFNNISDLAGWYEQRANKAIADKKFFTFLGNDSFITPANKAPQGWVTLDPDRFPKFSLNIDGDKYSGAYKAPPELGKIINNYLRDPQFDLLTKVANYVSRVKNITLNFGIPGTAINMHGVNILARHTLMGTGGNPVSRWMTGIKYMVNPKSAQHELDKVLIRSPKAIKDGLTLSAEDYTGFGKQAQNLAGQFSKKWEDAFATPLFNKMIPTLKLSSYEELVKNGMDGKNAAKLVNNVYGGINWEQMGRNRDMQNLIRATILAPDWAETTLRLGGNLAKSMNPVHKSVVANRYRTMMATIVASYVAHNVVNKLTSGHYSYENEGGHTFEIEMGYTPDGQKRYFRPYGTALDMVRLPYDIAKSAVKGDFSTTFRTLRNRMSIPLGVGIGMATDENYRGQPIGYTGKDKFGNEVPLAQRVTGVGSELASLVGVPAFSRQLLSSATGQQGWEQGLTQGFELPFRYSNIGKSNIAQQVEPYTKDLKGKELYDFNKGLQGENKFSDNQIEFIKTGDKPNERVRQLIDKRAMNRENDKKKEELKATAGTTGGSVSGDMVVTNDGDIIDLSPPTKGQGIGAFANKDWNITKARQVWNANIPKDEKEKAIKKLGLEPKDVRYDALANYDVDIKSQYLISKSDTKDKLYENLLTGRVRSIGDNIFASDGVIDNLYEEGYLTSAERKYFKNLDYNKDGTRKKGSGGKGKKPAKITPPAFKEAPSTKITLSKPKLASVKLGGRKQSKVRPQGVDNFKKELAEIERRVKALV